MKTCGHVPSCDKKKKASRKLFCHAGVPSRDKKKKREAILSCRRAITRQKKKQAGSSFVMRAGHHMIKKKASGKLFCHTGGPEKQ